MATPSAMGPDPAMAVEGVVVAGRQPLQRERGGRTLGQHDEPLRRRLGADQDKPAPVAAAGADHGHQPARVLVVSGARRRLYPAGPGLPVRDQLAWVVVAGVKGEYLVPQRLQHDRYAGQAASLREDVGRLGALDAEPGEGLVHLLGGPQLGELGVHDELSHRLSHGREAHLATKRDERQLDC
jgi:hypothetical protein